MYRKSVLFSYAESSNSGNIARLQIVAYKMICLCKRLIINTDY